MATKKHSVASVTNLVKGKRAAKKTVVEIPAPEARVETAKIELPKDPGATKLTDKLTPEQLKQQINDLLDELRGSTSKNDKKRIRRMLRSRGHRGGLGVVKATTKPADPDDDGYDEDDDD